MPHLRQVFCGTSWELEDERRAFQEAVGKFNETHAMPAGVLYVPVSLVNIREKRALQHVIEENIRASSHFVLVVSDGWGPAERNFEKDLRVAMQSLADPALPMRTVTVLTQSGPFQAELAGRGIQAAEFRDTSDFRERMNGMLAGWLDKDAASAPSATPAV